MMTAGKNYQLLFIMQYSAQILSKMDRFFPSIAYGCESQENYLSNIY